MSKFILIGGGLVAGTGFTTGVAGLTVMGMNESELDLMRKKAKIEEEKLKVQGEIVKLNEEIEQLNNKKKNLQDLKNKKTQREEETKKIAQQLSTNIQEFINNLNKYDKCYDLDLSKILGTESDLLKEMDWYKDMKSKFSGSAKFGKDCPEQL